MYGRPTSFFGDIAKRCNLLEGARGVESLVRVLYRYQDEKLVNKKLAKLIGIPVPIVSAIRKELQHDGFLLNNYRFSDSALIWLEETLGLKFKNDFFKEFDLSMEKKLPERYLTYFQPVVDYLEKRPEPDYTIDQSMSEIETVIRRALLMLRDGNVEGKKIVILGDDDGVSIALSYINCAKEITVIEIDNRIIDYLNGFKPQMRSPSLVRLYELDLRKPIPSELKKKFTVFETDPPYTLKGFQLFIDRATILLDPSSQSAGYVSFGHKTPYEQWKSQQYLIESGFRIMELFKNFNRYKGATLLGNTSNLYSVELVQEKVRVFQRKTIFERIYTKESAKKESIPTIGYQILGEFYGVDNKWLTDGNQLADLLKKGIGITNLKMEELFIKQYQPYGISVIGILVESHCHIHTWPEYNYLSIDLFVCEKEEKAEQLFSYLLAEIDPKDYSKIDFYRGGTKS